MLTIERVRKEVENRTTRSAWSKGVTVYAMELLDDLEESIERGYHYIEDIYSIPLLEKMLLNGAENWEQFSWGGCSLIYNGDIAERLCTPSELKKTRNGERRPNAREEWLDTQARALYQASTRILRSVGTLKRQEERGEI